MIIPDLPVPEKGVTGYWIWREGQPPLLALSGKVSEWEGLIQSNPFLSALRDTLPMSEEEWLATLPPEKK